MVDRDDSDGGRTIDADGERLVVVCLARSGEELAEVARLLEANGLTPVVLESDVAAASFVRTNIGPARLAVPASEVAEARRIMGGRAGRRRSLPASLESRAGRVAFRAVLLVLVVPLLLGLLFGIWMLGLAALGAIAIVSAAAYFADGVRRFFGSGSSRNPRTPSDDA